MEVNTDIKRVLDEDTDKVKKAWEQAVAEIEQQEKRITCKLGAF